MVVSFSKILFIVLLFGFGLCHSQEASARFHCQEVYRQNHDNREFSPREFARDRIPHKTIDNAFKDPVDGRLEINDFEIRRNLQDYDQLMKSKDVPALSELLTGLNDGDIFLDAGAGLAMAARDVVHNRHSQKFPHLKVIATGYRKPSDSGLEKDLSEYADRFIYVDGGRMEDLIADRSSALAPYLNQVAALAEIFGPLSYSRDLGAVLNGYADLLKLGGRALIYFHERASNFYIESEKYGRIRVPLREVAEFIPRLTGGRLAVVQARMRREGNWPIFEESIFYLQKVSDHAETHARSWIAQQYQDGAPPSRTFTLSNSDLLSFDPFRIREQQLHQEKSPFQLKIPVPSEFSLGQ